MMIPFALAYFHNGILAHLDDEKLTLMVEKRDAVDRVVGVKEKISAITAADRDLALNRERRNQLPADVEALSTFADKCETERAELDRSLQPKIAAAARRHAEVRREIDRYEETPSYLRRNLAALDKQIADWKNSLVVKIEACRAAAERFAVARDEYHARLDQEWTEKQQRKQDAQRKLDRAQDAAAVLVNQSDTAISRVTAPDLSARVRALGEMAGRDVIVAFVLAITYAFFFLIDIMPLLAKLVMRTTYDCRVSADYRRSTAKIELDTAIAETDMATCAAIAHAERLGLETLLKQVGSEAVAKLAKLRLQMEAEKADVTALFAQVTALIEEFHRTQARFDDIAERYSGRPELLHHIEAVRESLARAMQRASSVKAKASATA
jgi:chromosome segregation ATPase